MHVKGKDIIGIQTSIGTKYIRDILLVLTLNQYFLCVVKSTNFTSMTMCAPSMIRDNEEV